MKQIEALQRLRKLATPAVESRDVAALLQVSASNATTILRRLAAEGMIHDNELDLLQVCNEPQQVVDAIFAFYEKRGFEPSPAEREVLLNL